MGSQEAMSSTTVKLKHNNNWDIGVCELKNKKVERLIWHTKHGTIIIDVRLTDVNCFVFDKQGKRVDTVLLPV